MRGSSPPRQAAVGQLYTYPVRASDPDGDPLRYEVVSGPAGLTIDPLGRVSWPTAGVTPGSYAVQLRVSDSYGAAAPLHSYSITVRADTQPPAVQLTIAPYPTVPIGGTVYFQVTATDNVGVSRQTLEVRFEGETEPFWQPVALNGSGLGQVTARGLGLVRVRARAYDTANNQGEALDSFQVIDPNDLQPPQVAFLKLAADCDPDEPAADDQQISQPVVVCGTVDDPDSSVVSWVLEVQPADGRLPWRTLAQGTAEVFGGPLGTFDPTLLANGPYTLRLRASDGGGHPAEATRPITLVGKLKLGNFTVSFTDLHIPVAGIPITVTRTYDTLDAGRLGDFGYGWRLDLGDPKLQIGYPKEDGGADGLPRFRPGTRIVLTLADGSRQGFTFAPIHEVALGINRWRVYYRPDPSNTHRLTSADVYLQDFVHGDGRDGFEAIGLDGLMHPYHPGSRWFGRLFTLIDPYGTEYDLWADPREPETFGKFYAVRDRRGNELTYTWGGIKSNRGVEVTFERAPQGQITAITDPRGYQIRYQYDPLRGDLVAVTDRAGHVTQFRYRTEPGVEHYLERILDPLGRPAARTEYYPDGRVQKVIDADGKTIEYQYNTSTRIQRITNQLGHVTEIELDARGNAIREVSPEGVTILRQFENDRPTVEITVVGQIDSPENGETDDLKTTHTYNAQGHRTSTTNPRRKKTETRYNDFGEPLDIVDQLGNNTANTFDDYGRLTETRAPTGQVLRLDYGTETNPTDLYNGDGRLLVHTEYNRFGDVTSTAPAAGHVTYFDYDGNGNRVASWYFDGSGTAQVQVLDVTRYDDEGRAKAALRAVLPSGQFLTQNLETAAIPEQHVHWTTTTVYGPTGQVLRRTGRGCSCGRGTGLVTEYTYDVRGQQVQVRQQALDDNGNLVWLLTRTVYDAAGRVLATTEPYLEGTTEPVRGTLTTYDRDGRVTQTQQVKGIVITLEGTGSNLRAVLTNPGTVITTTTTVYGTANRVARTTDENGLQTQYTYGPFGETIETRRQAVNENGQIVWLVQRTVYDDYGRVQVATDEYLDGTTEPIYGTATEYDQLGRVKKSMRLRGVQINLVQQNGVSDTVLVTRGTELWSTETLYDEKGRVWRTIAADGQLTDYLYDELGRQEAVLGHPLSLAEAGLTPQELGLASGEGVVVRHRTETVYNAEGQVEAERRNVRHIVLADGTVQINRAAAQTTTFAYDERGNLTKTTFPDGSFITAVYDKLGRKVSETNQLGLTRTFEYDAADRLTAVELPGVVHPATGQVVRPRYEYRYDPQGNQTLLRDPLGRETRFTVTETATGQERTRTLPLGYGADGIRGTADDPPAGAWTERTVYDNRGRQILHVSFEGVVTEFRYHPQSGQLSQQRFFDNLTQYANGQGTPQEVWSFTSDAFGRLVRVERAVAGGSPAVTTYQYDGEGRVTRITSPEGVVSYTYDDLGRRTAVIVGTPTNPLRKTSFTYDALGRLRTVVEDRDATLTTDPLLTTTYAYDLVGNLRRMDLPNGVVVVYRYDTLNRLDVLTHYAPDATPENLADNARLAEFDYTVRADGRQVGVTETFWTPSGALTNQFTWGYDALGRLTSETLDSSDNARDYTATYTYDLVGNRVRYTKGGETVTSTYDVNDRLLQEVSSTGTTTTYGYNSTQQTSKTATAADGSRVITTFSYDLQGRLEIGTVETRTGAGTLLRWEKTTYDYDHTGIRVSALHEVDSNGDGAWDQRTRTDYLNDPHNHTGYSQVLRETYLDAATGVVQKRIDYTLGLDEIAQTTTTYDAAGNVVSRETLIFGHDGHGSVRVLFDLAGAILQLYVYQAYGQLAAIYNAAGQFVSANPADARTTILDDGEPFDNRIGWGYRRARWVDPHTGRFNQSDPFFGNLWNPQSFHKYLFTHADPVNGIDPTGNWTTPQIVTAISALSVISAFSAGAIVGYRSKVESDFWWEGFIPGWGNGRAFGANLAHGRYGWATLNLGLGVLDMFVITSFFRNIARGLTEGGLRALFSPGTVTPVVGKIPEATAPLNRHLAYKVVEWGSETMRRFHGTIRDGMSKLSRNPERHKELRGFLDRFLRGDSIFLDESR